MSGTAGASSGSTTTSYSGKAHENVPEFSGKAADYKEYRKRLLLYSKKMTLANRSSETVFNVLCTLKGRAWDATEDIPMDELEGSGAMNKILERLDKVFKYDAITELPGDFESFFCTLQRRKGATLQEYAGDFERALRKLEGHNVTLPDKVVGWYFMRRAGLSQAQRQLIMSSIGAETLSLETVRKAMNFVIGQDSVPDPDGYKSSPRWTKPYKNEAIYYEDDVPLEQIYEEQGYDPEYWDEGQAGHDGGNESAEEFEDEMILLANDDLTADYDDVMAGYTEARQKLNQMRMSRGYYPVVAMVPDQMTYKGPPKGKGLGTSKGKSKNKKGSPGSSKQAPKPPSAKARGRAALGAERCLRCGQAGHRAKNCPAAGGAGKRKAENSLEADVNMVESVDADDIQLTVEEPSKQVHDVAMMDCGAGSVLTSEGKLKSYLTMLKDAGFEIKNIPVFRCKKGFRFGNGEKNITSLCVLVPTFMEGKRRDVLMYIIPGQAPFLFGRPLLEALDITINYAAGKIRWGRKAWKKCLRGTKGEFICHMASDLQKLLKKEPHNVLLPDDFDQHVYPDILDINIFFDGQSANMLSVSEDSVHSVLEQETSTSFTSTASISAAQNFIAACEKSAAPSDDAEVTRAIHLDSPMSPDFQADSDDDVIVTHEVQCDLGTNHDEAECDDHHRLPTGKLKQLLHDTERRLKECDDVLRACPLMNYDKKYVLWELFAGEGRVTATANRRKNLSAERFSLADGWDFTRPSHRTAFLRRLREEEPDAVLLAPMCKLWSALQELSIAKDPSYEERLNEARDWDHINILMFCAVVYEHQRRHGRLALLEHPKGSRAWNTYAFQQMLGFDAEVHQCMFGLKLPDESGTIQPVRKPTNFRVTSQECANQLSRLCDGKHQHTHLEGHVPGVGLRSWLAESYPQPLATHLVNCILRELESQDEIFAVEDDAQADIRAYMTGQAEPATEPPSSHSKKGEIVDLETAESLEDLDPIRRNKILKSQVGPRAVEYVQRLHKNLGHP